MKGDGEKNFVRSVFPFLDAENFADDNWVNILKILFDR